MTTRCGFAAILGAPNAGKSTLLNRMAGAKLSIVSPKAQTTRFRVLGILMRDLQMKGDQAADRAQILLVDTPGIFKPRRKLDRAMVAAAWTGGQDADHKGEVADAAMLAGGVGRLDDGVLGVEAGKAKLHARNAHAGDGDGAD